jgi:hypothetical protein
MIRVCTPAACGSTSSTRGAAPRAFRCRPFGFTAARPARWTRPAPLLDPDSDRVPGELLGLAADELAVLHAAGVTTSAKT